MFQIRAEAPGDGAAIETLLDEFFGIRRHTKISYRYRIGRPPVEALSLGRLEGPSPGRLDPLLDPSAGRAAGPSSGPAGDRRRISGAWASAGRWSGKAWPGPPISATASSSWSAILPIMAASASRPPPPRSSMPGEDPARLQWLGLAGAAAPEAGGLLLRDGEEALTGADEGAARRDLARKDLEPGRPRSFPRRAPPRRAARCARGSASSATRSTRTPRGFSSRDRSSR